MTSKIEEARQRKISGKWNCAQAVACTYCREVGMDEDSMAAVGAAFGSGLGCTEGTCGALIGAGLVLGARLGNDRPRAMKAMARITRDFLSRNGSIVCKTLKGLDGGPVLRSCPDCVADAAQFLEETIASLGEDS